MKTGLQKLTRHFDEELKFLKGWIDQLRLQRSIRTKFKSTTIILTMTKSMHMMMACTRSTIKGTKSTTSMMTITSTMPRI